MIEVNGVAHTILTVCDLDRSAAFYDPLLTFMGMKKVFSEERFHYWVGGRTALGLQPEDPQHAGGRFVQYRVGLHHHCFRARQREDVDALGAFLQEQGATVVRGPTEGEWAPGYYYVLFEDPDGIRLEICHVPGRGVLAEDTEFNGRSGGFGGATN